MSSNIASSLVLVLLCFSCHACNARSTIGVGHKETVAKAKEFQHSISKKNEKLNSARVSIQLERRMIEESSAANATKDAKDENRFDQKAKIESKHHELRKHIPAKKGINMDKVSVTTRTESPVASRVVSWRVPHRKRGEKEPGFNLDYLPPKTHPPVHN